MRSSVDVHNHLQSLGIQHELVPLPGVVRDAEQMAELLDLEPGAIVKPMIFIADQNPVLALIPGDRKPAIAKLKKHLGARRLASATEHEVFEIADFVVKAVPPVALKKTVPAIAQNELAGNHIVYTSGGEPNIVLKMRSSDLVKATRAALADICCPA